MYLLDRIAISENYAFGSNTTFGTLSPVDPTHPTAIRVTSHSQQYNKIASYSKAHNRIVIIISSLPLSTTPTFRTTDYLQTKRDSQT
jgi:hypothetical protein